MNTFVRPFQHFKHSFMHTSSSKDECTAKLCHPKNQSLSQIEPLVYSSFPLGTSMGISNSAFIKTRHCSTFGSFCALELECNNKAIVRSLVYLVILQWPKLLVGHGNKQSENESWDTSPLPHFSSYFNHSLW